MTTDPMAFLRERYAAMVKADAECVGRWNVHDVKYLAGQAQFAFFMACRSRLPEVLDELEKHRIAAIACRATKAAEVRP